MPKVKGKKFLYTKEGIKDAQEFKRGKKNKKNERRESNAKRKMY
tara:strand:+ start:218 stop:349 length:132 start_codon:yes stop_codon:yes gene_type:complete